MSLVAFAVLQTSGLMGQARYVAGSVEVDKSAPGGFGSSDNYPLAIDSGIPAEALSVKREGKHLVVTIANRDNGNLWIQAADSNLMGWLEAKDGATWKPIQYHTWASCGNSNHRVKLPKGFYWRFEEPIADGRMVTDVRFVLLTNENRSREEEPVYSKSFRVSLDAGVFRLPAPVSADSVLKTDRVVPTLMPKGMGG